MTFSLIKKKVRRPAEPHTYGLWIEESAPTTPDGSLIASKLRFFRRAVLLSGLQRAKVSDEAKAFGVTKGFDETPRL